MRTTFFYNPFDRLTPSTIRFSKACGELYWVVQPLRWPGRRYDNALMVSRYTKIEDAVKHCQHLPAGEGKMLDISKDNELLNALLQNGQVFIAVFGKEDWQEGLRSRYEARFVAYLVKRTGAAELQGGHVKLFIEYGRLIAEIRAKTKKPLRIPVDQILKA